MRAATGVALLLALAVLAGCAAGPTGPGAKQPTSTVAKKITSGGGAGASAAVDSTPAAPDWEHFAQTNKSLRQEIALGAEAMKSGPVGNRAVELASLRMAASGFDLVASSSWKAAVPTLQRAISMDGANGYAYLFLAYIHQVTGEGELAGEFAANAARLLPETHAVRAELAGLQLAIRKTGGVGAR